MAYVDSMKHTDSLYSRMPQIPLLHIPHIPPLPGLSSCKSRFDEELKRLEFYFTPMHPVLEHYMIQSGTLVSRRVLLFATSPLERLLDHLHKIWNDLMQRLPMLLDELAGYEVVISTHCRSITFPTKSVLCGWSKSRLAFQTHQSQFGATDQIALEQWTCGDVWRAAHPAMRGTNVKSEHRIDMKYSFAPVCRALPDAMCVPQQLVASHDRNDGENLTSRLAPMSHIAGQDSRPYTPENLNEIQTGPLAAPISSSHDFCTRINEDRAFDASWLGSLADSSQRLFSKPRAIDPRNIVQELQQCDPIYNATPHHERTIADSPLLKSRSVIDGAACIETDVMGCRSEAGPQTPEAFSVSLLLDSFVTEDLPGPSPLAIPSFADATSAAISMGNTIDESRDWIIESADWSILNDPLPTAQATAPLATAPLATAPLATAPLATSPLATEPLTTAPLETAPLETAEPESSRVSFIRALSTTIEKASFKRKRRITPQQVDANPADDGHVFRDVMGRVKYIKRLSEQRERDQRKRQKRTDAAFRPFTQRLDTVMSNHKW